MPDLRVLDLFCGAGGASLGLHRAGFDVAVPPALAEAVARVNRPIGT